MKQRHQTEYEQFSKSCIFYAFTNQSFIDGMSRFNLDANNAGDVKKIKSLGAGGYILRDREHEFDAMFTRFTQEKREACKDYEFAFSMYHYELGNHEYGYTWDDGDAIRVTPFTRSEIQNNPTLLKALTDAKKAQREWYALHG
jgi:hypothetical protein